MSSFKIIVKKEFLLLKTLLTIIYIAMEMYYSYFISEQYDYMGFIPDLNLLKYAITKVVFLLLLIGSFNLYNQSKFLYSIYLLLIFFFYIPNAILFSFSNFPTGPFVSNAFFVSFFLITPYIKFPIPDLSIPVKYKGLTLISIALLLLIPILLTFKLNINLRTLLLSEIYETRETFSKNLHGILAYFYNLEAKTIIPVSLVFFMISRRYFFIGLLLLLLLYLFVISGNKLVYFTSIIVVFFFYIGRSHVSKLSNFFLIVLIFFALVPIIDNFIFKINLLGGTFINRFLFIPALTTQFYFDFFDGNPFYFAESHFFNHFVHSPYDMPIGFLITKVYWGDSTAFANNGIVSDGFMNLGYIGVILFSAIFIFLFSLFNSFRLHKGYYGIFFCYIYIILSAPLLTCLITGGIFLFILLSILILNNRKSISIST
ncbi:MAG: oligosaccharide repeat unit polymerase [Bacteroidetes bacterium]|nr:oligosaccharide repeat unit polymerase [Bacteroidota bacterium]